MQTAAPAVSIVVPVYNEVPASKGDSFSPRIEKLLELLRPCDEIVLVDGSSRDFSWQALQNLALHPQVFAMQSGKGRAHQMNAGAAQAKGDVLLFLHADTVLNAAAWSELLAVVRCPVWGRFDVRIHGQSKWLPLVAWFMNQRSRLSKIGTGDQALFIERTLFEQVGGFPQQPLMEDIELCKRLKRHSPQRFLAVREPVFTSGRRWDTEGAWKTIVLMWRFRFQYWRGVPALKLAQQYADAREKLPRTIAVFAKYPEPGRVKTRLQPLLGAKQCANFARYLLLSTLDKLRGENVVLWTDGGTDAQWNELLTDREVERYVQPQGHLGVRMQTAVDAHLKYSKLVVLLGPDAVQFTVNNLVQLELAAKKQSVALVPALDGGYVALACTRSLPTIFSDSIQWGSASVAEQTRAALHACGVEAKWFDAQLDIDEPEDLEFAIEKGFVPIDWAECYTKDWVSTLSSLEGR